ncbi:MAG: TonB-dependent receptor [Rhodothalassiaceae bacterium]
MTDRAARRATWALTALSSAAVTQPGIAADEEGMIVYDGPIEQVTVTGSPIQRDPFTTPAQVDVLSGELKRRLQVPSIGATLDDLAGVANIGTGAQVGTPVIRGLSQNRVRVLSNDIGLSYQQFGVRHPVNLDPYVADRFEVVRGAASVQYGSDVLGGALNVITDRPYRGMAVATDLSGLATAEYSSAYDQVTTALEASAVSGPWGADGTFVYRDSAGLEVPDVPTALETGDPQGPLVTGDLSIPEFDQINGAFAIGRALPNGGVSVRWEGWRNDQNFLVPDPPPPDGNPLQAGALGQRLENDIVQVRGDFAIADGLRLEPSFTWVRNLRLSNAGPPEPVALPATRDTAVIDLRRDSLTGRAVLHHDAIAGLFQGQVGVQIDYEQQNSRGPVALVPGGTVENYAVFAFEQVSFGPLLVDLGLRVDHRQTEADPDRTFDDVGIPGVSDDPDVPDDPDLQRQTVTTVSGGVGASYVVTEDLVISANIGSGFRAPTLFDLFVNGVHGGVAAVQVGDPTLEEERSLNTDLTLRWRTDLVQVTAAVYRNHIDGFIFPGGTGEMDAASGLPIFQVQQDDATLVGGDIDLSVTPTDWFTWRLTYERVEGSLDANDTEVPLLPADRIANFFTVERDQVGLLATLYLTTELRFVFDKAAAGLLEPFGQFDEPPPPFGTGSTDDYFIVNLRGGFSAGPLTFQVAVTNLFDEAYVDFLDTYKNITLSPGRDIRLTLSAAF